MTINLQDINHVAKLSHLAMSDSEKELLTKQLDDILGYANQLNSLDTTNVEPTAHAIPQQTAFREDVQATFSNRDQLLANAPDAENDYFAVPKI